MEPESQPASKFSFLSLIGLVGTVAFLGWILTTCTAAVFKSTPGQQAFDECVKKYLKEGGMTRQRTNICKGIKEAVDSGKLAP